MSLLSRCYALTEQREQIKYLRSGEQEAKRLRELSRDISTHLDASRDLLSKYDLFVKEKISFDPVQPSQVLSCLEVLQRIKDQFSSSPCVSTLISKKNWPNLDSSLNSLERLQKDSLRNGWNSFIQGFLVGNSPEMFENIIVPTEANLRLLSQYKEAYKALRSLKAETVDKELIEEVRVKGQTIQTIAKQLKDVKAPESVKLFLRAISNGGASLDLLTVEVVDWLKEQNRGDQYKIVGVS
jgi:hypothetical protein